MEKNDEVPVHVKYGSHDETVWCARGMNTSQLCAFITKRTEIPKQHQKLLVPGFGLIRPGADGKILPIERLKDKKVRLLGSSSPLVEPTPTINFDQDPEIAESRGMAAWAHDRVKTKFRRAAQEFTEAGPQARTAEEALTGYFVASLEDLEEGEILEVRRFGKLASRDDLTERGRLERLIGMNVIPRLVDPHLACDNCAVLFVHEWIQFLCRFTRLSVSIAEQLFGTMPHNRMHRDLLDGLRFHCNSLIREADTLINKRSDRRCEHLYAAVRSMIIALAITSLDFQIANEGKNKTACKEDILSFFNIECELVRVLENGQKRPMNEPPCLYTSSRINEYTGSTQVDQSKLVDHTAIKPSNSSSEVKNQHMTFEVSNVDGTISMSDADPGYSVDKTARVSENERGAQSWAYDAWNLFEPPTGRTAFSLSSEDPEAVLRQSAKGGKRRCGDHCANWKSAAKYLEQKDRIDQLE